VGLVYWASKNLGCLATRIAQPQTPLASHIAFELTPKAY
jgi:hypothetical protein